MQANCEECGKKYNKIKSAKTCGVKCSDKRRHAYEEQYRASRKKKTRKA